MRGAALALASVCVLAACNQGAPSAGNAGGGLFPDLTHTAYRAEATVTGQDGSTVPVVMVRDGMKQRVEFGQTTMIINGEGDSYIISNTGGRTMAMRMTEATSSQFTDPAKLWSQELASNAHRTGSCSAAGESGAEWTRDDNGVANVACVTSDGIILSSRQGDRTVWQTTSIQRGPQSADQFALPPGAQVVDLGNMGQAMQDAMERAKAASGQ